MEESIPKEHPLESKCHPDILAMAHLIMMLAEFRSAETFNEKSTFFEIPSSVFQ